MRGLSARLRRLLCLLAIVLGLLVAAAPHAPARAGEVTVSLGAGGGSLFPWKAFGEIGHAFGGVVLVGMSDFEFGLGGAVVYPDSRVQGRFGGFWAEGRWYPWGRGAASQLGLLQPYVVAALGFATADDPPVVLDFAPVRWASHGPSPLGGLGLGVRLGESRGLFLAADFRAWNHTHGGFALSAGYTF